MTWTLDGVWLVVGVESLLLLALVLWVKLKHERVSELLVELDELTHQHQETVGETQRAYAQLRDIRARLETKARAKPRPKKEGK